MYVPNERQARYAQFCWSHCMSNFTEGLCPRPPSTSPRWWFVVPLVCTEARGKHPCVNVKTKLSSTYSTWNTVECKISVTLLIILFDQSDLPLYDTSPLVGSCGNRNRWWKVSAAVPHPSCLCLGAKGGSFPAASLRLGVFLVFTMLTTTNLWCVWLSWLVRRFITHYCAKPFRKAWNTTHLIFSWLTTWQA